MMRRLLLVGVCCLLVANVAKGATEVEMADCNFTPEVKKELRLTAEQEPKVEKVISELARLRGQIQESRRKRDELRKSGAQERQVAEQTSHLISLENQCRDQSHQMLKPLLTSAQLQKLLDMEEVHNKRLRERQAAGQPGHP